MLIEFNVGNFKSIRYPQTFSMAASSSQRAERNKEENLFWANNVRLLKTTAIYGPNASGKSNLLEALNIIRTVVAESGTKYQKDDELPITPFKLSDKSKNKPSEFEVIFIADDGVRYQYGFSATSKRIYDEWLYAFPYGRPQTWISRIWKEEKQQYEWGRDNKLKGSKKLWRNATRENSLFLSTAIHLNCEQLIPVFNWLTKKFKTVSHHGVSPGFTAKNCKDNTEMREKVKKYLKAADIGIHDFEIREEIFDENKQLSGVPNELKEFLSKNLSSKKILEIDSIHLNENGDQEKFDFDEEESEGTKKLFAFAGPWIDSIEKGFIIFIDELNNSLHPNLVKFLINLFHDQNVNTTNAQLIFTTHEASLLNSDLFRRDQIWFCDKNGYEGNMIYSLSQYTPRKETNLEFSYLSGKFDAVPLITPLEN